MRKIHQITLVLTLMFAFATSAYAGIIDTPAPPPPPPAASSSANVEENPALRSTDVAGSFNQDSLAEEALNLFQLFLTVF